MPFHTLLPRAALACLLVALSSCGRTPSAAADALADAGPGSAATAPESTPATAAAPEGVGACRLLSRSDVATLVRDPGDGVRNPHTWQSGLEVCDWSGPRGRMQVQVDKVRGSVQDELRTIVAGALDPATQAAPERLRFEPLRGVGDAGMLVVEPADASRGVLMDVAAVVVQRGQRSLQITVDGTGSRDREQVVAAMTSLATSAAARL